MKISTAVLVSGVVLATASTLAACASDPGYAPIDAATGHSFGYSDKPNGVGGYTIRVVLPYGVRDPRSAFAHWDRRAAELCAPRSYRKHISVAERNMLYLPNSGPATLNYEVVGEAYCEPAVGDVTVSASAAAR